MKVKEFIEKLNKYLKKGKEPIIIGKIPEDFKIGDNSVFISFKDGEENIIFNESTKSIAIGYGAKADSESIAIGHGEKAGKFDKG